LKKGSSSNSFPKTFSIKFSPVRALSVLLLIFTSCVERPVGAKFSYKVFGKGARGDSPQCGEMSRSDRGARLRQRRTFPQKGLSPIITHNLLYKHHGYGSFYHSSKNVVLYSATRARSPWQSISISSRLMSLRIKKNNSA